MPLTPWECSPCSCDQETILFSTVAAACTTGLKSHSWQAPHVLGSCRTPHQHPLSGHRLQRTSPEAWALRVRHCPALRIT